MRKKIFNSGSFTAYESGCCGDSEFFVCNAKEKIIRRNIQTAQEAIDICRNFENNLSTNIVMPQTNGYIT